MQTLDSQIQDLTSRLSADLMGIIRGARITDLLGVPETLASTPRVRKAPRARRTRTPVAALPQYEKVTEVSNRIARPEASIGIDDQGRWELLVDGVRRTANTRRRDTVRAARRLGITIE